MFLIGIILLRRNVYPTKSNHATFLVCMVLKICRFIVFVGLFVVVVFWGEGHLV